ncbi:MAG TPA: hypothetical protein VJK02_15915 [Anaerolineales bacterium]|nr:hypothetical protein [Anaerolineales bacterium]
MRLAPLWQLGRLARAEANGFPGDVLSLNLFEGKRMSLLVIRGECNGSGTAGGSQADA